MSNYRIVFLLCQSLSTFFFWNAGFGFVGLGGIVVGFGAGGAANSIVSLVLGAFIRFFSVTISSTLVGQSSFEGEALSNNLKNDPHFKALARSCTGLLLIVFGANQLLGSFLSLSTSYSFLMRGGSDYFYLGMMGMLLIVPALEIALGIYLAYGSSLKRLSQSLTGATLASPDETESKNDSSL